jgi:hypothetical protein
MEPKTGVTVDEIDFGFELCNTAGTTQTFAVNGYSLSAS